MKRDEGFRALARHLTDQLVVSTYTSAFDWLAIRPSPFNYFAVGVMGLASSHGLGLALGRPDRQVVVLDGDGSLLMNLGTLASVAAAAPVNFVHFVCENGTYEANGGHPIPAQGSIDFVGLAAAAGYSSSHRISNLEDFEARIPALLREKGPVFVALKVEPGVPSPKNYPYLHSAEARATFKAALGP